MSSLRDRNLLYARLEEVLGSEPAGILMSHISTETDPATKTDIVDLGERLGVRVDGIDTRLDAADVRFDAIDARLDRIDTRIDRIEVRLDAVDVRLDAVDARFDGIDARLDRIDTRIDRLEAHMVRFDDKLDGFHAALREQTRTYMFTMTGVMASFAAVVVAAGILT